MMVGANMYYEFDSFIINHVGGGTLFLLFFVTIFVISRFTYKKVWIQEDYDAGKNAVIIGIVCTIGTPLCMIFLPFIVALFCLAIGIGSMMGASYTQPMAKKK
jgi:fucose permease